MIEDDITYDEFKKFASGDDVIEDSELRELLNAKFKTGERHGGNRSALQRKQVNDTVETSERHRGNR